MERKRPVYTPGRKLFQQKYLHVRPDELYYYFSLSEIRQMDPKKSRLLLENIARNAHGTYRKAALLRLGAEEIPPGEFVAPFDEMIRILKEEILQIDDIASYCLLKDASFDSHCAAATFAFCRLTGSELFFRDEDDDLYLVSCGILSYMTEEDIREFCQEMVEKKGPFATSANAVLQTLREEMSGPHDGYFVGQEGLEA